MLNFAQNGIEKRTKNGGVLKFFKVDFFTFWNKYNSFLKWKEEQSILENKPNEIVQTPNLTQFVTVSPQNNNTDEDKDIKDLVEDIFGDGD